MEERVYFVTHFHMISIIKGIRVRAWEWELKQRLWRRAAYYCSHCFLSLHSYTTQDHFSRSAPPTVNWALPHQLLIEKMPHRLAHMWHCLS